MRISKYDPRIWKNKLYSGLRTNCTEGAKYELWAEGHALESEWWADHRLQIEDVRRAYGERCFLVSPALISPFWTALMPTRLTDFNKWSDHPARREQISWNAKRMKWRVQRS